MERRVIREREGQEYKWKQSKLAPEVLIQQNDIYKWRSGKTSVYRAPTEADVGLLRIRNCTEKLPDTWILR
jgi:hypothetical protein